MKTGLPFAIFALAVAICPAVGDDHLIQPSHFALGKVCAGTTVEVSVRAFGDAATVSGLAVKATSPGFLEIERLEIVGPKRAHGKTACDAFFTVDTSKIGEFAGVVRFELGERVAELPVSVEVVERPPGYPSVLFVTTPFDRFSTSDGSHFAPLVELVSGLKISANYCHKLPEDITRFHVILLAADELCRLNASDSTRLHTFVATGGRLIIAANAFFISTVPKANELLKDYGLEIDNRDPTREFVATEVADDPLTAGVQRLAFFRPSLVRVTDDSKAKILVPVVGGGFAAVSRNRSKGEVIILTQSLWWSWIASGDGNHDNARLLENMLVPE